MFTSTKMPDGRSISRWRMSASLRAGAWVAALAATASTSALAQDRGEARDGIAPGWKVIEGDIVVRIGDEGGGGIAGTYANNFWPSGVVPYIFDGNMSATNQQIALDCIAILEAQCAIDFVVRTNQADYVRIRQASANNSPVGKQGGEQIINFASWTQPYRLVHEMMHCIGFWHEQSRADRIIFVTINWSNIQSGAEGNFDIRDNGGEYGPYDFDSVMHYDRCAFSIGCDPGQTCNCTTNTETITATPLYASQQNLMGQRDHLSYMDRMTLGSLYPPSNRRFADIDYNGAQLGTFFNPFKLFTIAITGTPANGQLWMQPGNYAAVGTWNKAMTIRAPLGGVTLSN